MKLMHIPIAKPVFDEKEKEMIIQPLETGWVVQGPFVNRFQHLFCDFTGAQYAQATSNCTTALHLGLLALGIGPGDKVIVPSFTYVASANAIEAAGAEAVFCDIDLKTFNLDEAQIEPLIQNDPSIKAIMPVNLFGLCANLPFIMELCRRYGLKIIEDSACGFDAWIEDRHSGTFGDVGCFSFHPRKSICTGEGGMLITNDATIAATVSQLKDHGAGKSDLQRHKEKGGSLLPDFTLRGYNYRMTDMQGALGVCQMEKSPSIMERKRVIAARYDTALQSIPQLSTPYVPDGYIHGYQSYVCLFTDGENLSNLTKEQIDRINIKRNIFMERLDELGISTRQGTHAVHTLDYYKKKNGFNDDDFLFSYAADRLSIALPLYAQMSEEEFNYVIQSMQEILN